MSASRKAPKQVALFGETSARQAIAMINAQWSRYLLPDYRLASIRGEVSSRRRYDYFIHHDYASDFKATVPPSGTRAIAVRTWDFGKFPAPWVERICQHYDQLWVYCAWVRANAIHGGVPAGRVKVIPLGFDDRIFRPEGPRYRLPHPDCFHFLFVGAAVLRKGIDILLEAYRLAFSRRDRVCLVIKDHSDHTFYAGIRLKDRIERLARGSRSPRVHYIDRFLSPSRLAGLYRACDAGVFPYRAEGFSLPILEAMASGLPSIVPDFGACRDYCSERTSYFVPVTRIHLPIIGRFRINTLGFTEPVDEVDFCEVRPDDLAEAMQRLFAASRRGREQKGHEGARVAHRRFTWAHSARKVRRHLEELDEMDA